MYAAAPRSFNDSLWKVVRSNSELDHVEQAYVVATGMLVLKLMIPKQ